MISEKSPNVGPDVASEFHLFSVGQTQTESKTESSATPSGPGHADGPGWIWMAAAAHCQSEAARDASQARLRPRHNHDAQPGPVGWQARRTGACSNHSSPVFMSRYFE